MAQQISTLASEEINSVAGGHGGGMSSSGGFTGDGTGTGGSVTGTGTALQDGGSTNTSGG